MSQVGESKICFQFPICTLVSLVILVTNTEITYNPHEASIYNPCLSSFLFSTILHHSLHCPTLPYPTLPYPALPYPRTLGI